MPTPTWTPMANITLSSTASSVTFSNIPNTYRDLILIYNGTNSDSNAGMEIYLNGDSNNRSLVWMIGQSSGVSSGTSSLMQIFGSIDRTSAILHIFDYSVTDKHKTLLWRDNVIGSAVRANAGRWASTAVVTSLTITRPAATISSGSTFALYGVIA